MAARYRMKELIKLRHFVKGIRINYVFKRSVTVTGRPHSGARTVLTPIIPRAADATRNYFSTKTSDLVIRHAKAEDYTGVMAIMDNVYDGQDYLPAMFNTYLNTDNMVMALAEHNGEIAGFLLLLIVDGGHTVVRQAGRVKPEMQRKDIMKKITSFTILEAHARGWCVANPKIMWTSSNAQEVTKMQQKAITTFTTSRMRIGFEWTKKELQSFLAAASPSVDVSLLTLSQAEQFLQEERVLSMSPDKRWIIRCESEPMSAAACNVRYVTRELAASVCASYDGTLSSGVSIGTCFPCKAGMLFSMAFHNHPDYKSTAESILCSHILQQMHRAVQLKFDTLHFVCLVTNEIDHQYVQYRAFPDIPISSIQRNSKPLYLVENNMDDILPPKHKL